MSRTGCRLSYESFANTFGRLLDTTGLSAGPSGTRPRIHDYRHAFAVRTLLDWYRDRVDVHALLPRLTAYIGHRDPAATYWNLSAAPELMALVADRLEQGHPDQAGQQR